MSIEDFLHTARPKPLKGNWDEGFALDFYGRFQGGVKVETELGQQLHGFKYHNQKEFAQPLIDKLADFVRKHSTYQKADVLLAIPSTKKDRTYQPVDLLAQGLSEAVGLKLIPHLLIRIRQTEYQKSMNNIEQKRHNIAGAFGIKHPESVRNQQVLLLDDLFDTGETLKEATRVLKRNGVSSVYVLTLAKTMGQSRYVRREYH
jgi:ComF family protein